MCFGKKRKVRPIKCSFITEDIIMDKPAGVLPIAKLDVFELTGHQNPSQSFFGSEWCLLSLEDLYVFRVFDRGTHEGYWEG